jgi:CRP/FNR family transcriptional regulator, cyclic AMP receptor protein
LIKRMSSAKNFRFNPHFFLSTIGGGRKRVCFQRNKRIFTQGDSTNGLFFIRRGRVLLSVISNGGKEATLGILSEGDFVGEGGLAGQPSRTSSALAVTNCVLMHIEKQVMLQTLSLEPRLSALFVKYLLRRNHRYQEDLIDQLFNSSEKRLARVFLLMAQFGKKGIPEMTVPRLSQTTMAEMVGTSPSRISFFMKRFKKLGFITNEVGDTLQVHSSLLNVVLYDDDRTGVTPSVHTKKVLQAPARRGGSPDQDRAKKPSLHTVPIGRR